jgi:hypothetical protein
VDAQHAHDINASHRRNPQYASQSRFSRVAQDDQTRDQGVSNEDLPAAREEGDHCEFSGKAKATANQSENYLLEVSRFQESDCVIRQIDAKCWETHIVTIERGVQARVASTMWTPINLRVLKCQPKHIYTKVTLVSPISWNGKLGYWSGCQGRHQQEVLLWLWSLISVARNSLRNFRTP